MFQRILKLLGISLVGFCALAFFVIIGTMAHSYFTKPHFPVEYTPLCGVDDYINGNCIKHIKGYKQGDSSYPLITENDWIIYTIRTGKQIENFGMAYSKKQLLDTSEREIEWRLKNNDNGNRDREIARIQSFIDILSKEQ